MADIKVQRKSAGPWWLWLILALVAAALLWWAFTAWTGGDEGPDVSAGPAVLAPADTTGAVAAPGSGPTAGDQAGGTGAPITDVETLVNASDPSALVGREVRLEDVAVESMAGDATFWVGRRGGRVFVVLDEQIPSPPPLVEGRVNVNVGQTVDLQGRVRRADDLPAGDVLGSAERQAIAGERIYIWASAVQVATPESAAPAGPPGRPSR